MRLQGLFEAFSFLRGQSVPAAQKTCLLQYAMDAAGADGHDVLVEQHVREPPVTIVLVFRIVGDDGLLFPILQPVAASNPGVVPVGLAVAPTPFVVLAPPDAEPVRQSRRGNFRFFRPLAHVIDHRVA